MKLFDGKKAAEKILEEVKTAIEGENLKPGLAVILIGENEASKIYIRLKKEAAERVGVIFELFKYDVPTQCHSRASFCHSREGGNLEKILKQVQDDVIKKIEELNERSDISGIIVQLPLPSGLDRDKIISAIEPSKDVDGFHKENRLLFEKGEEIFKPVLPSAILLAIKDVLSDNLSGKKTVALVNSDVFGNVLKTLLGREGVGLEYIIRKTCSVLGTEDDISQAEILITVCGCPDLVRGEMIKKGAVVIDGGIYRFKDGRVCGDVNRQSVENKALFLTPVPGGLGPLVIALLLENVLVAARKAEK